MSALAAQVARLEALAARQQTAFEAQKGEFSGLCGGRSGREPARETASPAPPAPSRRTLVHGITGASFDAAVAATATGDAAAATATGCGPGRWINAGPATAFVNTGADLPGS